jgi:polyhydroxyalkanoate synthase
MLAATVWSYFINNWFMGRRPPAFDILSWNADSTTIDTPMYG